MGNENTENRQVQQIDLNQVRKNKREKLANLQAEGKDPFQITKYDVNMHSQDIKDHFDECEGKSVSINIGMRDVKNQEIVDYIYDFLSTTGHPENFTFELLENEDVGDYGILLNFVDKIHELGGFIAIDDFGSGYSNLQHILSIQSDFIKIDGSIIRNCCVDKDAENLIALITGWKNLSSRNVKIVAEFVENEEIQTKLTIYDVDYSQGYLFSKPAPDIDDGKAKKAKQK